MKKLFASLKKYYPEIIRGLLFLFSIGVIVYVFPCERKFRYDFQEGKPWREDVLIAPFDFPVYKSDEKIKAEEDSVLKKLKPYFEYKDSVGKSQMQRLEDTLEKKWEKHVAYLKKMHDAPINKRRLAVEREKCFSYALDLLTNVYERGVLQQVDINENMGSKAAYQVYVKRGEDKKTYQLSEVFSQKGAYQYIVDNYEEKYDTIKPVREEERFLKSLNFNEFIVPNLNYDKETTQKVKENMLDEILPTKGMVQSGQRIISRGDLVKAEKYRILQSFKRKYQDIYGASNYLVLLGQIIFVSVAFLVLFLFLFNFRKEILQNGLKTAFILFLVVFFVVMANLLIRYSAISLYIIPFALVAIIIRTFYDARTALFIHIVTILIIGYNVPDPFEFIFLNFIAGVVAIFSLTNLYRRGKLFHAAAFVFLTYTVVYFSLSVIKEDSILNINYLNFLWFALNCLLILISYPLIYVFEKLFGFLSDATLMELSDTNQPLLRAMAEKAPGTFQHSLQVANLAEEAIRQIGGDTLLVRTGALYHDIGKMENPGFFVENQTKDNNPHDNCTFEQSARIIIDHVKNGVELAKKSRLPEGLINFIKAHHGTTVVQYFYKSYLNKYPDKEDDIYKFRYPGPAPLNKEMAAVMMADAVEAASRSYKSLTEKTIDKLVEGIIDAQVKQEQFNDADITLKDISLIKELFKIYMLKIHHGRIKYPK